MPTTTCQHKEQIEDIGKGIQHGTCTICGQVRRYNLRELKEKPQIIKLGKLKGAVVLPGFKDALELSTEETDELAAARKEPAVVEQKTPAPAAAGEEQPEPYVGKPRTHARGIRKWRARCKACEFSYLHDDILWCSSKRCPQRCPPKVRPQYRPKVGSQVPSAKPRKAKREGKPQEPSINTRAPLNIEDAEELCPGCPVLEAFKGYRMAVGDILAKRKKPRVSR